MPRKKKSADPQKKPAAPRKKAPDPAQAANIPVESTKHKDRRPNIPTRELSKFADDDERKPKTILYPRDPSLDPQLVWKGKDEQDRAPLEVPAVPVYIQEKIHPQALIEEVRLRAEREKRGVSPPVDLFADFNGLDDFEKKVDLLADSFEGRKKEFEVLGKLPELTQPGSPFSNDIRRGFVYKRVPHVTLKSIANNPDIKEGMSRAESDAAIKKHAETETLFDQPYQDNAIIRVSGPFTVESLSPHRMLPEPSPVARTSQSVLKDQPPPHGLGSPCYEPTNDESDFVHSILDNLRKAGVQNTVKQERLLFDRLDPAAAGVYIQAEGDYTEKGQRRRVKVCIGPQFGTVGRELLQEAAKEATQGFGCDLLLVCGFAFDPHVGEEAKQFGKLRILCTKMNPDLALGHDMLKKTGAGNLFMVFGEPDIDIARQKDGKIVVEIKGVDVFDPTTGAIRSHSTADIACWFIDSAYNGESFFVRHAYFCGGDEPYEKLKRALKAEIDEAEWAKLYSTRSVPFAPPAGGKIAVKVINHYGDEVLKVYEVGR